MKAPDKICIRKDDTAPFGFTRHWIYTTKVQEQDIEYIRKDALFDYFHQRVEELNSPLNGVLGSTEREHCNERISELLLLIDKLNEM